MRVVYVYGPPGVGKLTVARELVAQTGFRLLHNHLTVNLVSTLFPHGTADFTRLVRQFRLTMMEEAVRANVDLVVTNVNTGSAAQHAFIQSLTDVVAAGGCMTVFVQLTCRRDVWLTRIASESRLSESKPTDPAVILRLFENKDPFARLPFEPLLTLDTTNLSPADAAAQIAEHYALPVRATIAES
ncbi:MAG: AAA family ATPase [Chloroflexi bacterium]|nr:AAA family ATPase [Chloroflexota bacterium]